MRDKWKAITVHDAVAPQWLYDSLMRAEKHGRVRNVQRDGYTVSYEQLTWDNSIEGEEDES
ncbi:hypothetical protein NVP1242O_37 [Vibrio phage 1.242.O._10N.261.54.B2]|nr:hypothetical protein NVP1242O_37 [Vibrio phage 1.242.O._10N.261.54.B2]